MNQAPQPPRKVPLILVSSNIEDQKASITEIEQHGFEVIHCTDGNKALSVQDSRPPLWKPGLFLVDVVLPQISSFELVRKISDKWGGKKMMIVMMAQSPTNEDLLESTSAGAVGVMKKPLCWKTLDDVFEKERMKRLKSEIADIVVKSEGGI